MMQEYNDDLLKANIGEKKPFIPKPDLSFREYNAIKNFYSQADFERNSFVTLCLPISTGLLWFA